MKLGIIILTWNSGTNIRKCLPSLKKFIKVPNHLYVVDNDSQDSTVDFLKKNYPSITLIESPSNLGFAAGNNVGIKQAIRDGCDYLLLLNDDTYLIEDFITPCIKILEEDSTIGTIGPIVVEDFNHKQIQSAGGKIKLITLDMPYIGRNETYIESNDISEVDYVLGAALFIRVDVIKKMQYVLDPEYFPAYVEEVDFCYRVKKEGYRNVVYHAVRVVHLGGQSGGNLSVQYRRILVNKILFALKHLSLFHTLFVVQVLLTKYIANVLLKKIEKK